MKTLIVLACLFCASLAQAYTVQLQWPAPVISADKSNTPTGYKVYRGGTFINNVVYPTNTFTDTVSGVGGTQVCYTVSAVNSAGESAQSIPGCGQLPIVIQVPGVPGQVVIIQITP